MTREDQLHGFFMLESFLNYLKNEKRYSNHTLTAYQSDIKAFISFLKETYDQNDLVDAKDFQIRTWLSSLMEFGISPRSIHRKRTSLNSLYNYMMRNGMISVNPAARIPLPKISKRLPVFASETNMKDAETSFPMPDTFESARDRLMFEMLYMTGMRLSELISLTENSIQRRNNLIKVIGKRRKERLIPFGNKLKCWMEIYEKERDARFEDFQTDDYYFLTSGGKKLYPKLVYRTINYYLSVVSTIDKKSPHIMRHTFATHMLNEGADLNAIKEILGHASLAATQVYTHNSIRQLKSVYKKSHPKA